LLLPVLSATVGLSLTRTDMLSITMAAIVLPLVVMILMAFRQRLPALMLVLGALWGMAALLWDAVQVHVDASWLHGDMVISADIEQVEAFPAYRRYRINHISRADGESLPGKALLYQHSAGDAPLQAGQRIRVPAHWHLPRNYRNPGAFDYRTWCFDRHLALIGSMKGKPEIIRVAVPWLERQRQKVRAIITMAYEPDQPNQSYMAPHTSDMISHADDSGILRALLLGERSQLTAHANDVFAATGTAHLLAISGMHIGMAAAWIFALLRFFLTRREAWMVRLPVRNIAMIGGFLAAVAYATMAGWPVPAVRAAIMLAAAALAWCLAARNEPLNTLLAALGLILLFDPAAIASLSLWLSFVATAALLLWAGKPEHEDRLPVGQRLSVLGKTVLWISLLATLATLPLIVATFGRVPAYSLPANLIMAPLYALVVMPAGIVAELLALAGLDSIAAPLMHLAGMAVETGTSALTALSDLPAGHVWATHPPSWAQLLYIGGMAGCGAMLWRGKHLNAMLSAMLVLSIWLGVVLHETSVRQAQWIVWDVGQGAASTLLLPGNRIIAVDAPGRRGSRFNGGASEAAGLRSLGITHLDVLALTHAQSDHLGGALSLMKSMNSIGELWLPDVPSAKADTRVSDIVTYAISHGTTVRWLAKGGHIVLGDTPESGTDVTILWPPRSFDPPNPNNTSLTLAVRLPDQQRLLWPGDIETEAETAMLAAGLEQADAMLMPHHGSATSSQLAFVNALHPSLAIAQTGFANRYGFPKPAVVARYRNTGAAVRNTADGAVLVRWPDDNMNIDIKQWDASTSMRRDQALALLL